MNSQVAQTTTTADESAIRAFHRQMIDAWNHGFWLAYIIITNEHLLVIYIIQSSCVSAYHKDYRYVPLNGGHRALGDCIAGLQLIKKMAADSDRINCPVPIPESKRKFNSQ